MQHAMTSLAEFMKELDKVVDRNPSFNEALDDFEPLRASLTDHTDWVGRAEEQSQTYQNY
jgi:predicted metal-dependent enzyme (double-stranded beta helix superfamily)